MSQHELRDGRSVVTARFLRRCALVMAAMVAAVALLAIIGTVLGIPWLASFRAGGVVTKMNTAVALLLAAISLGAQLVRPSLRWRRAAQGCAVVVVAVGLLSLAEYLFHVDFHIDQLLWREAPGASGTFHVGRPAPNSALALSFLAVALLILRAHSRRAAMLAHLLSLGGLAIATLALLGYVFGAVGFLGIEGAPIAFSTTVALLLLSTACLIARTDGALVAALTSERAGGVMARRLLVPIVAVPLLLGVLVATGVRAGLYDDRFADALNVILVMGALLALVGWNARLLDEMDAQRDEAERERIRLHLDVVDRKKAEEVLRESEARLRDLADNIAQFAWIADETGSIFWFNKRWYDYTGATLEETKGWGWQSVHHPDHIQRVIGKRSRCFATGEPWEDTFPLRSKSGEYRWFLSRALPIHDSAGKVVRWFGTNTDVTEQRATQERMLLLAELSAALAGTLTEEEMLQRAVKTATSGYARYCIIDLIEADQLRRAAAAGSDADDDELASALASYPLRRQQLEALPEAARVLRDCEPLLVINPPESLLRGVARDEQHLNLLRALECDSAITAPMVARDRLLGAVTFVRRRAQRRFDDGDLKPAESFARRLALALDNARLLGAEQRARQEAEEASQAKDQFVALVSHELRNPLSAIASGIHLLRASCRVDQRASRALEIVERNTKLQTRLINDLLDLSRLQRRKLHLQRAPVELSKAVGAACQSYEAEAREARLSVRCQLEPNLWVHGDFDRLQQAVTNFLSNAVKFTPVGGNIAVTTERRDARARVTVADTGIGIDRAALERLFMIFQQGEVAGPRKPGLGIGLALVKGIVERHGGSVWAESEGTGQGSRFIVELPLMAVPNWQIGPGPQSAATDQHEERRISILVVEDNPDTRSLIADALTLAGYEVQTAVSGEDALQVLTRARPDVMLVDIGLPGMDGFEFLRGARRLPGMSEVPAFAVTGYGAEEDVRKGREAGFTGHFVKPVDVAALTERIPEWVGGR